MLNLPTRVSSVNINPTFPKTESVQHLNFKLALKKWNSAIWFWESNLLLNVFHKWREGVQRQILNAKLLRKHFWILSVRVQQSKHDRYRALAALTFWSSNLKAKCFTSWRESAETSSNFMQWHPIMVLFRQMTQESYVY